MQESHTRAATRVRFDDQSVVAHAGLVPVLRIAHDAGLPQRAQRLTIAGHAGANPAAKVLSIVAGMAAGADSIDDLDVLRHGAMHRLFTGIRAPSTLGTFLRGFEIGHATALETIATDTLTQLVRHTPRLLAGVDQYAFLDLDSKITPVFGRSKIGAKYGYTGHRGYHFLAATLSTPIAAPVIVATRLRGGNADTRRNAVSFLKQALRTTRACGADGTVHLRADSGYYTGAIAHTVVAAGACFSITAPQHRPIQATIATIPDTAWTDITYATPVFDDDTRTWIHTAQVAETTHTAFTNITQNPHGPITARLIVRRHRTHTTNQQGELFPTWRHHAILTNTHLDTTTAEHHHRGRAGTIEQVFADLNNSALAHFPSGQFHANAAWLTLAALTHNLLRTAGTQASVFHAKARTTTLRRHLITIPARITHTARQLTLRLPQHWPWQHAYQALHDTTTTRTP